MPGKRQRIQSDHDAEILPTANGKRQRQFTEKHENLANIYERLADEKSDERIGAAKDLLEQLSISDSPDIQATEQAFNRLIRGLCSGRKSARYGFFVALTELLRQSYNNETPSAVEQHLTKNGLVSLVDSLTRSGGKLAGQEKRDHNFGRLYACKSIIQSGILFKSESNLSIWHSVLDMIIRLAKSVLWIREECGMVLCDSIDELSKATNETPFVQSCLEQLQTHQLLRSPEGVAVWLTTVARIPTFKVFPSNGWLRNDPLHPENRSDLIKSMKEQSQSNEANAKEQGSSGFWQQSVHFAWMIVLQSTLKRGQDAQDEFTLFGEVWRSLVDNTLCSEKSSVERKYWACQLFSKLVLSTDMEALHLLYSPNVLRVIMEHSSDSKKLLHDAAKDCLKKMRARVQSQPQAGEIIIGCLTKSPGTPFFDRITKTRTLEELLSLTDEDTFVKTLKYLEQIMINQQGKDEKTAENTRQAIADIMLAAFKTKSKYKEFDCSTTISDLLGIFLSFAYCKPRPTITDSKPLPNPEASDSTRATFHSRTSSLLSHMLSVRPHSVSKYAWKAVHKLKSMTKSSKPYQLALEADDTIWDILSRSYTVAERLEKGSKKNPTRAFDSAICLFFCLALLQAYSGDTAAVTDLEDLYKCHQSISADDSFGAHFDLLLELLLGFLSKPSALFRNMAEQVFTAISGSLTKEALQSLINILQTPESFAGQQELFDANEDIADEGADDSSDDSSVDSDVEVLDAEAESSDEDSGDDGDSAPEDDQDEDELVQFNNKLAKVLQTASAANADEMDVSEDESMDDDQMMELDSHIVKVFRERHIHKSKQKEKREAKGNVTNFKRRVLDLLSIYMKQEASNPLALDLLPPLLELMRTTKDKSLETKSNEVLKALYTTCTKTKTLPKLESNTLALDTLREIHQEVQRNGSKFHNAACSRASVFVVKVLLNLDHSNYDHALEVYSDTQKAWFQDKNLVVQTTFFTEWVSFSVEIRKHKR